MTQSKASNLSSLLVGIGALLAGGVLAGHYLIRTDKQREQEGFDELEIADLSPRELWRIAWSHARKERVELRRELAEYDRMADVVTEVLEIREGLSACGRMLLDPEVPTQVADAIMTHWSARFASLITGPMPLTNDMAKAVMRSQQKRLGKIQPEPHCSFCGLRRKDVKALVAGPGVQICDACVDLAQDVIQEKKA